MSITKTSRRQIQVVFLAAVLVLSTVIVGVFTAAAQSSAPEELDTENPELVGHSSVDRSLDTQTVVPEELTNHEGTTVVLLSVDRDISESAVSAGQVDAATLQADSEATLGPVVEAASAMEGVTVRNEFWVGNVVSVRVDLGAVDLADLAAIDGVTGIASNAEMSVQSSTQAQEDPEVDIDLDANYTYGLRQIDVPGFEEKYNASGEGTTVAVIDDGISNPEEGHPDLEFVIKAVAENGSVTTGTLGQPTELAHGEHVAGTATGAADPAGDVPRYGVAPNASLIKIKPGERSDVTVENILASMEFAVEQDADVVSMSLGIPEETPGDSVLELMMEQQTQTALTAGTVVVGAAGNIGAGDAGGPVRSPGANFNVLSVGASNEARDIADLSSGTIIDRFSVDYNTSVGGAAEYPEFYPRQYVKPDVSAPGVGILSAGPLGSQAGGRGIVPDPAATYSIQQGTSMAAPHVSGAVALIQSATEGETPAPLIRNALAETAKKPDTEFPSRYGRDIRYGTGIINVTAATDAIVDGSLTVEGEVTDSDGDPVVGAVVRSEAGALTSTDESGSYTLHTTSESVNVTVSGFGVDSQTRLVESDTDPVDFRNTSTVSADVLEEQPETTAFGGGVNTNLDVANLERLTINLTAESTVAPEDVMVTLNGDELSLGEPLAFNETVEGQVTLTVNLATDGSYTEGDVLGLKHTFEGAGDSVVVETGPTELTKSLAPPEYEVSNLSAPTEATAGDPIPVSFEITNIGDQTPDSYGYRLLATSSAGRLPGQPTELTVEPGETRTVSASTVDFQSDTGDFFNLGEVLTLEARVGQVGNFGVDRVDDEATTNLALQAEGTQFDITGLDVPSTADPGQRIDVTATVESVGELGDTQTVEFTLDGSVVASESVTLDAFTLGDGADNTTVTFSDVRLPDTEGYFEPSVSTGNDTTGAPIAVGSEFQNVTVVQSRLFGPQGEATADLLRESLSLRYRVSAVVGAGRVDGSVIRETDVFVFYGLGDVAPDLVPTVESDPLTNAVYLEQRSDSNSISSSNGISGRADVLNDPKAVVSESNDAAPVEFTIEQDHPIFDGVGSAGDVVPIHSGGNANFAWFENASGETLATVDDQNTTDGRSGPSVTVDPDSGAVLLSTIAASPRGPGSIAPANFTAEASQILANAVAFAEPDGPEAPFFRVSGLSAPAQADVGATVDVNATVTNRGNQTDTQTVEFVFDGSVAATVTDVQLDPGTGTTVEFTDVPLPGDGGIFEHGVRTANESLTAEIQVGTPDIELVELTQPDERTLEQEFTTEITLINNGTAPYEGRLTQATNLDDTSPDGVVSLNRTTVRLAPGESTTVTRSGPPFAEFNEVVGTNFAPGDDVETGYQLSQHFGLDASRDSGVEAVYSEDISIVPTGPPNVSMADLRIAGEGVNATVAAGSYDVTAEVSHTAGASGDVPVELTVGEETLSKNVSLETNQTVTVTFEFATNDLEPGTYDVTMSGSTDAVSGTLTLSMDGGDDDDNDGTTDGDSGDAGDDNATDDGNDGTGPGFGPIVVLAGLGSAGYLLNRRGGTDETDSS
jgi:subtilisin family serine protease